MTLDDAANRLTKAGEENIKHAAQRKLDLLHIIGTCHGCPSYMPPTLPDTKGYCADKGGKFGDECFCENAVDQIIELYQKEGI